MSTANYLQVQQLSFRLARQNLVINPPSDNFPIVLPDSLNGYPSSNNNGEGITQATAMFGGVILRRNQERKSAIFSVIDNGAIGVSFIIAYGYKGIYTSVACAVGLTAQETIENLKAEIEASAGFATYGIELTIPSSRTNTLVMSGKGKIDFVSGPISGVNFYGEASYCIYQVWSLTQNSDGTNYFWKRVGKPRNAKDIIDFSEDVTGMSKIYVQIIDCDGYVLPIFGKYVSNEIYEAELANANAKFLEVYSTRIYNDELVGGTGMDLKRMNSDSLPVFGLNDSESGIDCKGCDIAGVIIDNDSGTNLTLWFYGQIGNTYVKIDEQSLTTPDNGYFEYNVSGFERFFAMAQTVDNYWRRYYFVK